MHDVLLCVIGIEPRGVFFGQQVLQRLPGILPEGFVTVSHQVTALDVELRRLLGVLLVSSGDVHRYLLCKGQFSVFHLLKSNTLCGQIFYKFLPFRIAHADVGQFKLLPALADAFHSIFVVQPDFVSALFRRRGVSHLQVTALPHGVMNIPQPIQFGLGSPFRRRPPARFLFCWVNGAATTASSTTAACAGSRTGAFEIHIVGNLHRLFLFRLTGWKYRFPSRSVFDAFPGLPCPIQ